MDPSRGRCGIPATPPRDRVTVQDGGGFRTGSGRTLRCAEEISSALCWRRRYARMDIQMVTSGILWNRRAVPEQTASSTLCPARCIESKATKLTTSLAADYQPTCLSEVC